MSKESDLRAMREARLKRPNPFEDAARGRDVHSPKLEKSNVRPTYPQENKVRNHDPERRDARLPVPRRDRPEQVQKVDSRSDVQESPRAVAIKPPSPLKRGRPKIEGPRPWELAGMSKRTWHRRRQKEAKK